MKVHTLSRMTAIWLATLIAVFPVYPTALGAADEMVTIDFANVDISEFVKTVSKLTKRNFLLDQGVRGTVTILGPRPVPISEVWRIFHTVLAVKGLTVVKVGELYKIVQRKNAKQQQVPIVVGRKVGEISEEPIIQIVPMDFSGAGDAKNFLDNFKSANGEILVHEPTNSLIIADQRDYVARMLRLLEHMDSTEVEQIIEVLKVEYMSVENAVSLVKEILTSTGTDSSGKPSPRARRRRSAQKSSSGELGANMVADARLNRLIVIGTKGEVDEIRDLLKLIDVEEENQRQNVHVYHLQHADAETLAGTLNSIGSTMTQRKGGSGKDAQQQPGDVKIVADKQNNSLIFVTENPDDLKAQLSLLEQLDVPKAQVYIQAAVVEVSLENNAGFQLGFAGGAEQDMFGQEGFIGGGAALGQAPVLLDPTSLFSGGLFAGAIVTPEDGGLPPIGAILKAVRGNANTNVLSTPQILSSDNEEAEIIVGDNVPFLTGQTATSGGNVISSINRQDVGLTLRVTPQVNDSGMVRMQIFQEISDVGNAPPGFDVNQQGLVTKKRSAKTNVVIRDGQTIAIGGLYTTNKTESETKVPILGDIPVIGWLFKSRQTQNRRTNLILFLEPKIVRSDRELQEVSLGITEHFVNRYGDKFISEQQDFFDSVIANSQAYLENAEKNFEQDMVVELEENRPVTDIEVENPGEPPAIAPLPATPATSPIPQARQTSPVTAPTATVPTTTPAAATAPTSQTEPVTSPLLVEEEFMLESTTNTRPESTTEPADAAAE